MTRTGSLDPGGAGVKISRADYDKPYRCPGWGGAGWKYNKVDWCEGDVPDRGLRWQQWVYDRPALWNWLPRKTRCCGTLVLPYYLRFLEWRTFVYWWRFR